jgi:hypothetical protein
MRDIVLRLSEKEAGVLYVMMEVLVLPLVADGADARAKLIKPVAESSLKKLQTPLKRRKVI